MATHFSVLSWRIPWIEVCWATAYGVPKSRTQLKQLGTHVYNWVYTVHLKLAQLYKSTVFQAWTMIGQILRKRARRKARTTSHVMLNLPLLWLCIEGIVCPVYLPCFNVMCMLSHFSHVPLSVTPWTVAHQILLSVGFSRQEYLSGLPSLPPRGSSQPRIEPRSPALAGGFFTTRAT